MTEAEAFDQGTLRNAQGVLLRPLPLRIDGLVPMPFEATQFNYGVRAKIRSSPRFAAHARALTIPATRLELIAVHFGLCRSLTVADPLVSNAGVPLETGLMWRLPPGYKVRTEQSLGPELEIFNRTNESQILSGAVLWCDRVVW